MATPVIERPSPSPIPASNGEPTRFVLVRANLMPDEIVRARLADVVRKRVIVAVAAVLAVLIAWYGLSWRQTASTQSSLDDARRQGTSLQNQTNQFAPLVRAQSDTEAIKSRLQKLMVGDLPWKTMLTTLRAAAPAGVELTQVTGTVSAGAAAAGSAPAPGGYSALNGSGQSEVGSVTITGTARDKRSVAAYADKLATAKGLAAPFITNVTAAGSTVTFTINVLVTAKSLGGRFTPPVAPGQAATPNQGGK